MKKLWYIVKILGEKSLTSNGVSFAHKCRNEYPLRLTIHNNSVLTSAARACFLNTIVVGMNHFIGEDDRLLTCSHSTVSMLFDLIMMPIHFHDKVCLSFESAILLRITLGEGCEVRDRLFHTHDVWSWKIVCGFPAKFIKKRELNND